MGNNVSGKEVCRMIEATLCDLRNDYGYLELRLGFSAGGVYILPFHGGLGTEWLLVRVCEGTRGRYRI